MEEIQPLRFRRYLLRNRHTGAALAIVEAHSIIEAQRRGSLLQTITNQFEDEGDLAAERADMPMRLPTFLNDYFGLLEKYS